jgi:hypothetical protein
MKASFIITIILRLFAIHWAASALLGLLGIIGYSAAIPSSPDNVGFFWMQMLAAPVCYILLALGAWYFAAYLAKRIVPHSDPEIGLVSITARDLYGFGILVIGVTSFLSHLAPMLNWIHYLVINRAGDSLMHGKDGLSFYDVTKEVIPCIGGAAIALYSSKIGERLARIERIQEAQQDAP